MRIQPIASFYITNNRQKQSSKYSYRLNNLIQADTISFSARRLEKSINERMSDYAIKLLKEQNLKKGQPLYIKGESYYLPLMETLSKEAYKIGAGLIFIDVIEPEIENLKEKYNRKNQFDYQKQRLSEFQKAQALFIEFDKTNDPYKKAKILKKEVYNKIEESATNIPTKIRKIFRLNPEEILINALDIKKGQPVLISGEREHLPFIKKLVEYLYSKNETDLVDINISNNNCKYEMIYGSDNHFEILPEHEIQQKKEYYEKDVAWLILSGKNPKKYENVPAEKLTKWQNLYNSNETYNEYSAKIVSNVPWLVYNLPTTESAQFAYPELAEDKIQLIAKAYEDASKINRTGKLKEHLEALNDRAMKLNKLIQNGYRTFYYFSVDEKTKLPDGKTDFKITVSPKSIFASCRNEMPQYGHSPIVNIPSEEVFTAPLANSANGVLSTTMPLSLNGNIINNITFTFKDGEVIDVKADKNEEILKNYIKNNKNANRLGELAIVVNSPIAKTGRVFNSTLLDENAACHFALGSAYPNTILDANKINDYKEQQAYLENNNINISPVHADFMIGGKNVYLTVINEETGDSIQLLKDDEFLL